VVWEVIRRFGRNEDVFFEGGLGEGGGSYTTLPKIYNPHGLNELFR